MLVSALLWKAHFKAWEKQKMIWEMVLYEKVKWSQASYSVSYLVAQFANILLHLLSDALQWHILKQFTIKKKKILVRRNILGRVLREEEHDRELK